MLLIVELLLLFEIIDSQLLVIMKEVFWAKLEACIDGSLWMSESSFCSVSGAFSSFFACYGSKNNFDYWNFFWTGEIFADWL